MRYLSRSHPDTRPATILAAALAGSEKAGQFEAAFAKHVGRRFAIAFPYARSAIMAVLRSEGIENAPVLLPAYSCGAVADAVTASSNVPRFVDIEENGFNIDVSQLEGIKDARCVIPINMFGVPADVRGIRRCLGDDVLIIEDACLSLLAARPPYFGDVSVYSFAIGKNLCCYGGGMVATDRPDIAQRLREFRGRQFQRTRIASSVKKIMLATSCLLAYAPALYSYAFRLYAKSPWLKRFRTRTSVTSTRLPADARKSMSAFQAAIGLAKLPALSRAEESLRKIARQYHDRLSGIPGLSLPAPGLAGSHYVVRVRNREQLLDRLAAGGISVGRTMDYDYVVPMTPAYEQFGVGGHYPNALKAAREVVNLPFHVRVTEADVERLSTGIRAALQQSN